MYVCVCVQGFLFKCLGVVMRKATQRQFVQKLLDTIFATVKHSNQVEREVHVHAHVYTVHVVQAENYNMYCTLKERERLESSLDLYKPRTF